MLEGADLLDHLAHDLLIRADERVSPGPTCEADQGGQRADSVLGGVLGRVLDVAERERDGRELLGHLLELGLQRLAGRAPGGTEHDDGSCILGQEGVKRVIAMSLHCVILFDMILCEAVRFYTGLRCLMNSGTL